MKEKHGRAVVVVLAVEEYERMKELVDMKNGCEGGASLARS